ILANMESQFRMHADDRTFNRRDRRVRREIRVSPAPPVANLYSAHSATSAVKRLLARTTEPPSPQSLRPPSGAPAIFPLRTCSPAGVHRPSVHVLMIIGSSREGHKNRRLAGRGNFTDRARA